MVRKPPRHDFMALSISLKKKKGNCSHQRKRERYPASPLSKPSALPPAPGAQALPEVLRVRRGCPPRSGSLPPRRAAITHTTKRGSGEPPAPVAREPGTGGRAPDQAGRTRGLEPLSVALALMDFLSSPLHIFCPLFFAAGQGQAATVFPHPRVLPPSHPQPTPPGLTLPAVGSPQWRASANLGAEHMAWRAPEAQGRWSRALPGKSARHPP